MRYSVTDDELHGSRVAPGTYQARIDKVTDKSSKSGNPVMWLTWTITGTEPPAGQKVPENVTMTPESYWRLEEIFEVTGFKSDGTGFDSQDLKGLEARIVVVQEEYEGRPRAKVQKHLPLE